MRMTASRRVARPAPEVFEFFSDATNNPHWQAGMVSCTWTTDPPIRVGSRYAQVARFMGREIRSRFEVTEYEPGRRIRIETLESTFPIQVNRRVEPIDAASCMVNAEITGGPRGIWRLFEPLMARRAQKSVDADYDRLKELLES
jgi:uncharacterized membrane protein